MVSQMPYRTAKPANNQNSDGMPPPSVGSVPAIAVGARNGSRPAATIRSTSSRVDRTGRPHQKPRPTKTATKTGARAVPSPSSALSVRTARSGVVGSEGGGVGVEHGHGQPEARAQKRGGHQQQRVRRGVALEAGGDDEDHHRADVRRNPRSRTCLLPKRAARRAPESEVAMAVSTCGRNMAPYWVLLRSYSVGSVKIVPAAGKVTNVMPWTNPRRLTTRVSARMPSPSLSRGGRSGPVRTVRHRQPSAPSPTLVRSFAGHRRQGLRAIEPCSYLSARRLSQVTRGHAAPRSAIGDTHRPWCGSFARPPTSAAW